MLSFELIVTSFSAVLEFSQQCLEYYCNNIPLFCNISIHLQSD